MDERGNDVDVVIDYLWGEPTAKGMVDLITHRRDRSKALTWIQYLSMFKYGFEALAVNEVATTKLIDNIQGVSFNVPGSLILQKLFGFELESYWRNVIVLIGFILLFIVN